MTEALRVDGLVKRYGGRVVVDGVSFSVAAGEIFALLGPNGAGKTTTIEICEGFRRPDAGAVAVLGRPPDTKALRACVGVMPQDSALQSQIRPREALRLFASMYADPEDPDVLLERLELHPRAHTPYRALSGGEKQRLSLALALVGRPRLLFCDEPTVGMDVGTRARTWEVIRELRDRGASVLLTTHLLDEAERVADRVAILHHGRMVALGPPRDLVASSPAAELRFRTDRPPDVEEIGRAAGVHISGTHADGYRVEVRATPEVVARLAASLARQGVLMVELTTGSRTLEEVFLQLTEGAGDR
ncbi:MAG TPA: ABC transporter ATP-binding protein [Actinomycetota bacterium]|nr:ABC transporter ATP-binding protein [Actinomycetota bacterium]